MAEAPGAEELEWFPETRASLLRNPVIRLLLPLVLVGICYASCFTFLPYRSALILGGLLIAYLIPPSGKESIIPLGIILGIPWEVMAASVVVMDVATGLFMILNLDVAFRIPRLGPWMATFMAHGKEFMAERPWLARLRVPGLAFFVWLPFQGTGGVGAALVGWMIGLRWWEVLLAIGIGASLEALLFALGYELIWTLLLDYLAPVLAISVILIIVAIVVLLLRSHGKTDQKE
ncbi:MAG: small multi-drug export protein [Methanomicrobiales archaeon]|nr:small multi-drug export protein [Methanomicrobiales archaeon]